MYRNKILIIDDDRNVLSSFKKILEQENYEIFTVDNAKEGFSVIEREAVDLIIMDIKMPGMTGLEALSKIKKIDAKIPVILMTAYGTIETAIEAIKLGAYEYLVKPFEVYDIKNIINKALEVARLMKVKVAYKPEEKFKGDRIVGTSFKMQWVYKLVAQVVATDVTVILRGESGTGKELIARAIYHHSKRKDKPFLVINSAAIPDTLLESELFGYEKGAFTDARERHIGRFEQYNGGTIFLDEIGDMSYLIQAKILRVLEDKSFERLGGNKTIKVDVRLIAATNKKLEILVKEGKFREDLFYRLNIVAIHIPPLREHKEDILPLVEYFLAKYSKEFDKDMRRVAPQALKLLQEYNWPGNVRELENVIKKAILLGKGDILLPEHIVDIKGVDSRMRGSEPKFSNLLSELIKQEIELKTGILYPTIIEKVEKILITEVLKQTQGNQTESAKLLGISRPTLKDKINRLGIRREIDIQVDE